MLPSLGLLSFACKKKSISKQEMATAASVYLAVTHLSASWGLEVITPNLLMLYSARRTTSTFSVCFRRLVGWKLKWLPGLLA